MNDYDLKDSTPFYELLSTEIPEEFMERMNPWILNFVGASPDEAKRIFATLWSGLTQPGLIELREILLQYRITGIIDDHEGGVICASRNRSGEPKRNDFWYFYPPVDPIKIFRQIELSNAKLSESARQFIVAFGSLAEFPPGNCGYFVFSTLHDWRFGKYFMRVEDDPVPENLADYLVIFLSIVSDEILLGVDGSVGWWVLEQGEFYKIAEDFDGFLKIYIEYLLEKSGPLESMATLEYRIYEH